MKKINFTKKLIFYKRSETGCNEVTFGDCNLDVGGVLGTLNNISMGKKGLAFFWLAKYLRLLCTTYYSIFGNVSLFTAYGYYITETDKLY